MLAIIFVTWGATGIRAVTPSDGMITELLQAQGKKQFKQDMPVDSLYVEVRQPGEAALDQFRNDPEFRYTEDFQYSKTFLGYIKYYLAKFFSKVFSLKNAGNWIRITLIVLLVAVAVFVLVRLLGVDVSGIFFKKPESVNLSESTIDENIHANGLNNLLEKALAGRQYRLAVRITYLIMLKRLSDAGQIHWQPDKTNRSYLNEIGGQPLRKLFSELTHLYEHVWYGDFDITAEHYNRFENDFNELKRLVR